MCVSHGAIRFSFVPCHWRLDLFAVMLMVYMETLTCLRDVSQSRRRTRAAALADAIGGVGPLGSSSLARLAGRHDIKRTLFMARSQGEATATATALILFHGVQQRFLAVVWKRVERKVKPH